MHKQKKENVSIPFLGIIRDFPERHPGFPGFSGILQDFSTVGACQQNPGVYNISSSSMNSLLDQKWA